MIGHSFSRKILRKMGSSRTEKLVHGKELVWLVYELSLLTLSDFNEFG